MMKDAQGFDAEAYVRENSYDLALTDHSELGRLLRCIDDRASDSEDREKSIAIPGAGLGLVMDALGAFTLLRRSGTHASIEPSEAILAVEKAIGPILFHTDEKSVQHNGLPCSGCGHATSALVEPIKCLLLESDAQYFIESGLLQLKEKLKSRGLTPTVYRGAHSAQAVFVVEGETLGLPSVGKSGAHVFVYHKDFHELLLKLIAHELHPLLSEHSQGVSIEKLEKELSESSSERLSVTLEKLAKGLPTFVVSKKSRLTVEPA